VAFPTVAGFGGSNSGANVTTTTVDLEALAGVASVGDLLLVIHAKDGTDAPTWPTGWTSLILTSFGAIVLSADWRIVQSGDPTSIDITHASEGTAHQVYRIGVGSFSLVNPVGVNGGSGSSSSPDPSLLDPIWPASFDVLWLAIAANDDGTSACTAAPASYTDLQNDRWSNVDGVGLATARRQNAADSEDPGTFTLAVSKTWHGATIAVPGLSGFPSAQLSGANSGGNVTTSSVDVTIAGTPVAGDLVIIGICKDGTGFFTWPATPAFTEITQFPRAIDAGSAQAMLDCRYRIWQAGDSTTVSITHANESTAWEVVRIAKDSFESATAPAAVTTAPGASTNPDPPNLDPAGWATEKTLWIALAGNDGNVAITAGPSGYFYFRNDRVAAATGAGIAVAWIESEAASENPGVFTMASENWGAGTIAIRPAAAVEAVRPSVYNVSQAVHRSFSY